MKGKVDRNVVVKAAPARRCTSGFGISEVLISVVVLTTAVLGIAATAARSGAILNKAHMRAGALAQARLEIEEILAQPYDSVEAGSAERGAVDIEWTVTNAQRMKELVLVYRYDVPGETRADTVTLAVRKP